MIVIFHQPPHISLVFNTLYFNERDQIRSEETIFLNLNEGFSSQLLKRSLHTVLFPVDCCCPSITAALEQSHLVSVVPLLYHMGKAAIFIRCNKLNNSPF